MKDLSGQVVKGYELRELIGVGGYGVVYRAFQPLVEREVAIKIILPQYANRPNFIRNFEFEAQLIARLEHLHIVPLYDYWREPDGAYIVMRFLRGGSLQQALRNGAWEIEDAARLLDQVASALAVAHRNGVIHQDLKSANILLDEDRNAYLTDFGIAKDLTRDARPEIDDDNNVVRGSPEYMSPEQILNASITGRTDIYSLGIVLYELLAGVTPFRSEDEQEVLQKQLYEEVPPLQEFRPDLPDEFNLVIRRATDKHPKRRYDSPVHMAEGFRQFVAIHMGQSVVSPVSDTASAATVTPSQPMKAEEQSDAAAIDLFEPVNPYKGLRSFQEADAADFFGREKLVGQLLQRMQEDGCEARFLAVVGPSGSGKSSVVKAGLIPALRTGALPGSEDWFIQEMTPGMHPFRELESTLLKIARQSDLPLLETLRGGKNGLHRALEQVLQDETGDFLLVIDQFEEIFTLIQDEPERRDLLSLLLQGIMAENSRLRLVITLRADFYDRPLLYSEFGNLLRQRTEVVLPLLPDELTEVIVNPAERVGLEVEEGLPEEIVADVSEQPGALPLLQYALTELFVNRDGITLTRGSYQKTGGVSGALTRRADELYMMMSGDSKEVTRQVFLRLVSLGEGTEDTRRRVLQSELASIQADKNAVQRVLETFGKYRLLAFDREPATRAPTVEIAHEALIREWQQLRRWLDDNRDALRVHRQLGQATAEWLSAGHDSSFLASGARLAQFETLHDSRALALNQDELNYLQASLKLQDRARRRRQLVITALTVISIVALILATLAVISQRQAEEASRIARSRALAVTALMSQEQLDLALLLDAEALETANTFDARSAMLSLLHSKQRLHMFLSGHTGWVRSVAFSPNSDLLASGSEDNTIRLWKMAADDSWQPVGNPLTGHQGRVNDLAFSPNGVWLASASADGTVRLWNVSTGQPVGNPLVGHNGVVWSVAFDPNGTVLVSAGDDDVIRLWDVSSGQSIGQPLAGHTDDIYSLAFSPNGSLLASAGADRTIRLWEWNARQPSSEVLGSHDNWVWSVDFSPDGSLLASGSEDRTIRLWDIGTGQARASLQGHTNAVRSVRFDRAGRFLASGGYDGQIGLWDYQAEQFIAGFSNLDRNGNSAPDPVLSMALQPGGVLLASASQFEDVILWDVQSNVRLGQVLTGHTERVSSVAFNSQGTQVVSVSNDQSNNTVPNVARFWSVAGGNSGRRQIILPKPQPRLVLSTALSLDGSLLATGGADQTIVLYDLASGSQIGQPLAGHANLIFSLAFSPDGRLLASGGGNGSIVLWTRAGNDSWQPLGNPLTGHTDRIWSLAFSPDGNLLASGSRDNSIRLWQIDENGAQQFGEPLTGHTDGIQSLAFSLDGKRLASGGRDATVRLWDIEGGAAQVLNGHNNVVNSLAFSPDGQLLASGSRDRTIILWDLTDASAVRALGQLIPGHTDAVNSLAFSPDSQLLVSGGEDNRVILWDVGLALWKDRACQIANRSLTQAEWQRYLGDQPYQPTCP